MRNKGILTAQCNGRAMLTTERMDPNLDNEDVRRTLPVTIQPDQKIFKHYVHVIPDRQHQIFKLVEEI